MSVLQTLINLLYPPTCLLCGGKAEIHSNLCRECYAVFIRETFEYCPLCMNTARKCTCGSNFLEHTRIEIGKRRFITLTFYKSYRKYGSSVSGSRLTEAMIYRLKEKCDFTDFFAAELAGEIKTTFDSAGEDLSEWILTYAPRTEENFIRFGFDQSEEIVRAISKILKIPYKKTINRLSGEEQKRLNGEERRLNAEASLAANPRNIKQGGKYLLFDDIITSGATITTIARNLYFYGAKAVFPVSIARTMPSEDRNSQTDIL